MKSYSIFALPHLKEVGLAPDSLNQADIDWLTLLCSTFRDHISYGAQIQGSCRHVHGRNSIP